MGEKFTPDLTIGREILSEWVSEWVFILRQKRVLLISKKLPQPTKKNSQNIHPLYPRHYKTLTFEDIINSQVPRPIVSRRTWLYYSPGPKIWRLMFIQAIWPGMVWYGLVWPIPLVWHTRQFKWLPDCPWLNGRWIGRIGRGHNLTHWCDVGELFDRLAHDWWRQRRGKKWSELTSTSAFLHHLSKHTHTQLNWVGLLEHIRESLVAYFIYFLKISKHLIWSGMECNPTQRKTRLDDKRGISSDLYWT